MINSKMFIEIVNCLKDLTTIRLEINKKLQIITMIIVYEYTIINSYIKYVFDYIKEIKSIESIKYFNSLKDYCIKNDVSIDKEYNDYSSVRKYLHDSLLGFKDKLISRFSLIITKLKRK